MNPDSTLPTTSPSLTWRGKLGWLVFFVVAIVLIPLSAFVTAPLGLGAMFVVALLVLAQVGFTAGLVYYPYRSFRGPGPNVRAVDEPTRTEYAGLCTDLDAPVRGVWVTDDLRHAYGFAQVFGVIPGNRHLFVDAEFFDLYAPEERRAVIARETELATSYYFYFAQTMPVLVGLFYFVVEALTVDSWVASRWPFVPMGLAALLLIGGVWTLRRKIYRADRFAAEQTSPETVVSALATFADEKRDSNAEWAYVKLASWFWTRPSPEKRIERLRDRFDAESTTEE